MGRGGDSRRTPASSHMRSGWGTGGEVHSGNSSKKALNGSALMVSEREHESRRG